MSLLQQWFGASGPPRPSRNKHYYDQLNDSAERVGMGRPFNGLMKFQDYRLTLAVVTLKAIEANPSSSQHTDGGLDAKDC